MILAFVSMFVADYQVRWHHAGPWPPNIPMPRELEWFLLWRNLSLLAVVVLILISIPRWQSLVGIGGLVIFFFLFGRV